MQPREPQQQNQRLLQRLDAIGAVLARDTQALALLGLGSVGVERDRLDAYSDLDFFAIVQPDAKQRYITDLTWLERVHPVAFSFQNTRDGDKVLFADGVYAEFAILTPDELRNISTHKGRVIWRSDGFDCDLDAVSSGYQPAAPPEAHPTDWLVGEIVTNVYVGMTRFHRGERLSAMRLIQTHAVDRLIELSSRLQTPASASADPFAPERRYEARFPELAVRLPSFIQGYERSPESALALLAFMEERYLPINDAIKRRILDLCALARSGETQ